MPIKVAPSSERSPGVNGSPDEVNVIPSDSHIEDAARRTKAVELVKTHGCMLCTVREVAFTVVANAEPYDGSRIQCPYLIRDEIKLTPEQADVAKECPIPGIYADVFDGKVRGLTAKEIESMVPSFGDPARQEKPHLNKLPKDVLEPSNLKVPKKDLASSDKGDS